MKRHFIYAGSKTPTFLVAQPWKSQGAFNTAGSTDFSSWSSTPPAGLTVRSRGMSFITKGYIYYCGGYSTGGSMVATVERAPLTAGVPGTFVADTSLPAVRLGGEAVFTRNHVHIIGGYITNTSTITSGVLVATIDPVTGLIGSWTSANSLPAAISRFGVAINHPYIYTFGGLANTGTGAPTANIYRAMINDDGTIGTWSTYGTMPSARMDVETVENDQYVFVCGGGGNGSGNAGTSWWYAAKNSDGSLGTFTVFTGSHAMAAGHTILTADYMFAMGGENASFVLQNVAYRAPITSGLPGSWTAITSLPSNAGRGGDFNHGLTAAQMVILGSCSAAPASTAQYLSSSFGGGLDDYVSAGYSYVLN